MIIKNLMQTQTVLSFDDTERSLSASTLFDFTQDDNSQSNFGQSGFSIPIPVLVNSKTYGLSSMVSASNQRLADAATLNASSAAFIQSSMDTLDEMDTLTTAAMEGSAADSDRSSLNTSMTELLDRLANYRDNASFKGLKLLQGGSVDIAAGMEGQTMPMALGDLNLDQLGLSGIDISTKAGAQDAKDIITSAMDDLNSQMNTFDNQDSFIRSQSDSQDAMLQSVTSGMTVNMQSNQNMQSALESIRKASAPLLNALVANNANTLKNAVNTILDQTQTLSDSLSETRAKQIEAEKKKTEEELKKAEAEKTTAQKTIKDKTAQKSDATASTQATIISTQANTSTISDTSPQVISIK